MQRGANRNLIVSHGGKHGNAAGTYLKGQVLPAPAAEAVPEHLQADVANRQPGAHGLLPPGARRKPPLPTTHFPPREGSQTPADAEPVAVRAEAALEGAASAPETPQEAPTEVAATTEPTPAPDAPTAPNDDPLAGGFDGDEAGDELPEGAEEAPSIPTSKRQLMRMPKADAYALALELGMDVPDNPDDIKGSDLKDRLATEIGL